MIIPSSQTQDLLRETIKRMIGDGMSTRDIRFVVNHELCHIEAYDQFRRDCFTGELMLPVECDRCDENGLSGPDGSLCELCHGERESYLPVEEVASMEPRRAR